jgi:hypothetical protein
MTRRASVLFLSSVIVLASACASLNMVVVRPNLPREDSVTQPSLQNFMRSAVNPSIVLRVPAPQGQLTQAQAQQGDLERSRAYNAIEKELVKAGFTVRDRGLLEEVLRSTQNLDYRVIQSKIEAQLILEIVSITPKDYSNDVYSRAKDNTTGRLRRGTFPLNGWQFQCKVVIVTSGEIGGIYTIDVAPVGRFLLAGENFTNANEQGQADRAHVGYKADLEATAPLFVQKLIARLKQPGTLADSKGDELTGLVRRK